MQIEPVPPLLCSFS